MSPYLGNSLNSLDALSGPIVDVTLDCSNTFFGSNFGIPDPKPPPNSSLNDGNPLEEKVKGNGFGNPETSGDETLSVGPATSRSGLFFNLSSFNFDLSLLMPSASTSFHF